MAHGIPAMMLVWLEGLAQQEQSNVGGLLQAPPRCPFAKFNLC